MTAAAIIALAAAIVASLAAAGTVSLLLRARARIRTLEQEFDRGKATFDELIERELEQRATELEQTMKLARAESLSALVDEERRITEERRRDVAERERDASAHLQQALKEAERRVDERLSIWGSDLVQLQESLAGELDALGQRLTQASGAAEAQINGEGVR